MENVASDRKPLEANTICTIIRRIFPKYIFRVLCRYRSVQPDIGHLAGCMIYVSLLRLTVSRHSLITLFFFYKYYFSARMNEVLKNLKDYDLDYRQNVSVPKVWGER